MKFSKIALQHCLSALLLIASSSVCVCGAFVVNSAQIQHARSVQCPSEEKVTCLNMFFADETPAKKEEPRVKEAPKLDLVMSDNENFLNAAGTFLVDAFWLNSPHHQIDTSNPISDEARIGLIVEQSADLQDKYGERMGKRLTRGAVIGALDPKTKKLVGLVTLKETLMKNDYILEAEKAEMMAKNAVASLGPKQRRMYKDAPVATVAEELLDADTKSVCVLSNLAVAPEARRQGVGNLLCTEVENLAADWGYQDLHLLVEEANTAGRKLYEGKLGYKVLSKLDGEAALRADMESGEFKEIQVDTLVMVKKV